MRALSSDLSHRLFAVALLGGFLAAVAGKPAQAQVNAPGSMCVRWAGPSLAIEPLNNGALLNPSTVTMRVDCPILKVRNDTGLNAAIVRVVDQHPTLDVTCRVCTTGRSPEVFGEIVACSDALDSSETPPGPGLRSLIFPPQADLLPNTLVQNWYFSCSIPPRFSTNTPASRIHSYLFQDAAQ
jgi:hypothetical protein